MFDKGSIRYKLVLTWLLLFALLWITFQLIFPLQTMKYQLSKIESSIESNDWNQANNYTTQFVNTFNKNRYLLQINNATEVFTTFEHSVGQLQITVKYKEYSAIEYVGALSEMLNFTVKPFAGP